MFLSTETSQIVKDEVENILWKREVKNVRSKLFAHKPKRINPSKSSTPYSLRKRKKGEETKC